VLVLPSVAETFGLVLVEAMACGLPAIASRAHCPVAIVAHGSTGWLIPPAEDVLVHACGVRVVFVNSVVADFQGNPESLASGISAASLDRGGQPRAIPAGA
jgi:glycosyltransferase involved in cell wall biosynthesis